MKKLFSPLLVSFLTFTGVQAGASEKPHLITLSENNISTNQLFSITSNSLTDGIMLGEEEEIFNQKMMSNSVWWQSDYLNITVDLKEIFLIQDILLQVNDNDIYQVDYSIDNLNWSNLFTINPNDGEIRWGMDIMSSDALNSEYVANLDFDAVNARYLRLSASGGDHLYAISELQLFSYDTLSRTQALTKVSPVPEPSSILLFGLGTLVLFASIHRRQKKTSSTETFST